MNRSWRTQVPWINGERGLSCRQRSLLGCRLSHEDYCLWEWAECTAGRALNKPELIGLFGDSVRQKWRP